MFHNFRVSAINVYSLYTRAWWGRIAVFHIEYRWIHSFTRVHSYVWTTHPSFEYIHMYALPTPHPGAFTCIYCTRALGEGGLPCFVLNTDEYTHKLECIHMYSSYPPHWSEFICVHCTCALGEKGLPCFVQMNALTKVKRDLLKTCCSVLQCQIETY